MALSQEESQEEGAARLVREMMEMEAAQMEEDRARRGLAVERELAARRAAEQVPGAGAEAASRCEMGTTAIAWDSPAPAAPRGSAGAEAFYNAPPRPRAEPGDHSGGGGAPPTAPHPPAAEASAAASAAAAAEVLGSRVLAACGAAAAVCERTASELERQRRQGTLDGPALPGRGD
jgi:hypothetical protein